MEWAPEFKENMSKASLKKWATRSPEKRHEIAMKVVEARRKNPSTRYYRPEKTFVPELRKMVDERMRRLASKLHET